MKKEVDAFIEKVSALTDHAYTNTIISKLSITSTYYTKNLLLDHQIQSKDKVFVINVSLPTNNTDLRNEVLGIVMKTNFFGSSKDKESSASRCRVNCDPHTHYATFTRGKLFDNPVRKEYQIYHKTPMTDYLSVFYDNAGDAISLIEKLCDSKAKNNLYHPKIICPTYNKESLFERLVIIPDVDESMILLMGKSYIRKVSDTCVREMSEIFNSTDLSYTKGMIHQIQNDILREEDHPITMTFSFDSSDKRINSLLTKSIEDKILCPKTFKRMFNGDIRGATVLVRRSHVSFIISKVKLLGGKIDSKIYIHLN